jgi:hypothetical protein
MLSHSGRACKLLIGCRGEEVAGRPGQLDQLQEASRAINFVCRWEGRLASLPPVASHRASTPNAKLAPCTCCPCRDPSGPASGYSSSPGGSGDERDPPPPTTRTPRRKPATAAAASAPAGPSPRMAAALGTSPRAGAAGALLRSRSAGRLLPSPLGSSTDPSQLRWGSTGIRSSLQPQSAESLLGRGSSAALQVGREGPTAAGLWVCG